MEKPIRRNEKCFIGMPACGYVYESAKLCFVACPSHSKYTLKIETIKRLVEDQQYECHIALKKIDPGSFAFCTKICSKIIQSQFCIVLLDPSIDKKNKEYPNPNVHFEYGMMISQNKHIIPLQEEQFNLAFNISPLDTIKYNDSNFKTKVSDSINYAIKLASEDKLTNTQPQGPEVLTFYSLEGYKLSDISINFFKLLFEHGSYLNFYLFENSRPNKKYKFVGNFDNSDPKIAILNTKILIDNIISTYTSLVGDPIMTEEESNKYRYLIDSVSVDLIIPPFYDKISVLEKIKNISNREYDYPIRIYYRNDFSEYIDNMYNSIGTIDSLK